MTATWGKLLGTAGPGESITIDGLTFTLTRSTKSIQAAWSKWLTDRAEERAFSTADKYMEKATEAFAKAEEINRRYRNVDPSTISAEENAKATEERDKHARQGRIYKQAATDVVERFNDRAASGEFEYFGNVAIDLAQQNLPGQIMLVYLCLKPKHPDITVEEVERLHMSDSNGENHIQEWRTALLKSEGVLVKKPENGSPTPQTEATQNTMTGGSESQ